MSQITDFIVIGGGVAGLTAGAVLAREGHRVAVFEKHSKLGGYMQYFGKDPTFDASTHLIGGIGPGGWTRTALAEAGVLDRVELITLDPVYRAMFPQHDYLAPRDPERFRQELSILWPAEAERIRRFFQDMEAMGREFFTLADGMPKEGLLAKYHDRTLSELLNDYTQTEELRAALSALWLMGGLPPERLSAIQYVLLWHTIHLQGTGFVKGGVHHLTQAMRDVITEHGGTVETGRCVQRIVRRGRRVTGVVLEDGAEYEARAVISTASPADTFEQLVVEETQDTSRYAPLRIGFVSSVSAVQVHLLVNGDLNVPARTTILNTSYDLEDEYFRLQRDDSDFPAMLVTVLDHQDPDRVPPGKHMVSLFTLCSYSRFDNWNVPWDLRRTKAYRALPDYTKLKAAIGEAVVRRAEEVLPGLSGHSETCKVATPLTMERYTFNTGGAAFGWANIPQQSGAHRPGPETPYPGLYMAGHWTFPGGTVAGAMTSGRIAAKVILARG